MAGFFMPGDIMALTLHTLLDGFKARSGEELAAVEAFVKRFEDHLKHDLHEVFGFFTAKMSDADPKAGEVAVASTEPPAGTSLTDAEKAIAAANPPQEPADVPTPPAIPGEHTDGA